MVGSSPLWSSRQPRWPPLFCVAALVAVTAADPTPTPAVSACIVSAGGRSFDLAELGGGGIGEAPLRQVSREAESLGWTYSFSACSAISPLPAACAGAAPGSAALQQTAGACYGLGASATRAIAATATGVALSFSGGDGGRSSVVTVECADVARPQVVRWSSGAAPGSYTALVRARAGCALECARDAATGAVCGGRGRGACATNGANAACVCSEGRLGPACDILNDASRGVAEIDGVFNHGFLGLLLGASLLFTIAGLFPCTVCTRNSRRWPLVLASMLLTGIIFVPYFLEPRFGRLGLVQPSSRRIVDGIYGGATLRAWPPRRSLAVLQLSESNADATLIIDNFFHLYQRPSRNREEKAGASQPTWSERAQRSSLLGLVDAPSSSQPMLPPPTCLPLEGGVLRHSLAGNASSFRVYKSGALLVDTGGNTFASSLHGAASASGQIDPHEASVRSLLWHRISAADREFHGLDFFAGTGNATHCSFTPAGRERFCARRSDYARDFEPETPCNPFIDPGPPHMTKWAPDAPLGWPYCNSPTLPLAIVSFDCGLIESFNTHWTIASNIMSLDNGGVVISSIMGQWSLPDVPVIEFDELACVGAAAYTTSPGHFHSEILPRLLALDLLLPEHIPLLWPSGSMTETVLAEFKDAGILSNLRWVCAIGLVLPRTR